MGERVLILDDDGAILDLLGQYLTTQGYECSLCPTGAEAFDQLKQDSFALLLADIGLPDMDGLDVVRKVRQTDSEIGIIIITGLSEVSAAVEAMRAGADDYLVKPLKFNEISVSVSKVLEKRNLVIENRRYQEDLELRVRAATENLERTNRELSHTKEYLENLLHSTVDTIITYDQTGKIGFANEGALQMLGYSKDELLGTLVANLFVGGHEEARKFWHSIEGEKPRENYESELKHKDGHVIPVNMSVSPVRDANGQVASWLAIGKDITEQKRLGQELKEMSIKDSLTGLYNHRHFYERLGPEIERALRQKHPLSLLLLDLDRFKPYNDRHGHLAGDDVLRAVGEVIGECTRVHVDLEFRYGGDEFTVILPEAEEKQAHHIAERIRATLEQRRFEGVSISIGVMEYQPELSLEQFVQYADAMMYEAKRSGGNRVCVFDPQVCADVLRGTIAAASLAQEEKQG